MNAGVRFGYLPFAPVGPGPLHGSFEVGLEPLYQRYFEPVDAFFAGLGATFRYHFLSLGRFVPYVELAAAAGGTDLKVREIRLGLHVHAVGRRRRCPSSSPTGPRCTAATATSTSPTATPTRPNRGFESHTGVVGVSFFFK